MKSQYRALFDLNGKTAIVTGAVGILGQGFCRGLAEFGAQVAVVDLNQTDAPHSPRSWSGTMAHRHSEWPAMSPIQSRWRRW